MPMELAKVTPENLKRLMGKGWNTELQRRSGKSKPIVTDVVNNLNFSHEVMKYAIALAEEKSAEAVAGAQKLGHLLDRVA